MAAVFFPATAARCLITWSEREYGDVPRWPRHPPSRPVNVSSHGADATDVAAPCSLHRAAHFSPDANGIWDLMTAPPPIVGGAEVEAQQRHQWRPFCFHWTIDDGWPVSLQSILWRFLFFTF